MTDEKISKEGKRKYCPNCGSCNYNYGLGYCRDCKLGTLKSLIEPKDKEDWEG